MKFEKNWFRVYRGEVLQRCDWTDDDGRQVIAIAHPEPCSGELKIEDVQEEPQSRNIAYQWHQE